MERNEKRPAKMSVPKFGGWDHKAADGTNYSLVFSQARANKKNQKTDLTELKRSSLGNEPDVKNGDHRLGHGHARARAHEEPALLGRKKTMKYINCCIMPRYDKNQRPLLDFQGH